MRKAWFCYEDSVRGPVPIIQYDEKSNQKNYLNPRVLQEHPLDESWPRTPDDEIQASFDQLKQAFPYVAPAEPSA